MRLPFPKVIAALMIAAGTVIAGACTAYCFATRDALTRWFLSLGPCIYRADNWQARFFTPAAKAAGNRYAAAGALLGLLVGIYSLRAFLRSHARQPLAEDSGPTKTSQKRDVWLRGVLAFAAGAWGWGMTVVVPCYDEVFSALNCAAMHPFQAWSYYMLPNNHVLLNLLNSLLPTAPDDKLLSARLLALGCYLALAALWYRWLTEQTGHRARAALFTAVLLLQFPVWAFAIQGRGYELCCLAGWAALLMTDRYQTHPSGNPWALRLATAAAVAGFAVVPTYLYFHLALVLWSTAKQLTRRRLDLRFWKHQAFTAAGVYLFYLPALLFSGLPALTDNKYVRQGTGTIADFLSLARGWIVQVVQFCFGGSVDALNAIYLVAFLLPGLLLLTRRSGLRKWGMVWCSLWLSVLLVLLQNRRVPFVRSLIIQCSMTLAFALLAVHALLQAGANWLKRPWLAPVGLALCTLAAALHFIRFDRDHTGEYIYMNDAAARYQTLVAGLKTIPEGSDVSVSAESFYWEYLARQRPYIVHRCPGEASAYYITDTAELLPAWLTRHYQLQATVQEYRIYRRTAARTDTGSAR